MELFSSSKVQTDSVAHSASYLIGTRVSLQGIKRPGLKVNDASPSSAEANNEWRYISPPPIRLHAVHRYNCVCT